MLQAQRELAALKFIDDLSAQLKDVRDPQKALRHALRDTRDFFQAADSCVATLRPGRDQAELLFTLPKQKRAITCCSTRTGSPSRWPTTTGARKSGSRASSTASEGGAPLLDTILADVQKELAGRPQSDDLTLLTARVLGAKGAALD